VTRLSLQSNDFEQITTTLADTYTIDMAQTMKAWQYTSVSGGIEKNLHLNDKAPRPVPADNEILVQVHAMAVNPVDYKVTESPAPLRLLGSTFTPGLDFCGKVAGVGKKVDEFKIGEFVFGAKMGESTSSVRSFASDAVLTLLSRRYI
jgi:alkaline phosphatase D